MDTATASNLAAAIDDLRDAVDALTPGSAAYARRLRDEYAGQFCAGHLAGPAEFRYSMNQARADANALIKALGYEPPEESP